MPRDRLLIVDDDAMVGETVRRLAAACDYEALATATPAQFLATLEAWKPTHLAVDLQMPEMDGVELLRRLADAGCRAKVIVMSGASGKVLEAARRLAAQRGLDVTEALRKPFRAAELRSVLERVRTTPRALSEAELDQAIDGGEFHMEYEPKIDLRDGRLVGFEALARWRRAAGVLVAPAEFIALAERSGQIRRLSSHFFDLALRDLAGWPPLPPGARVAVNLSAVELDDLALADRLAAQCAAAGATPERIAFEVTESAAIADPIKSVDVLTRLRLKGFDIALDDFGTGHSSLVMLQRLPVSEIKVDQSFVRECVASTDARAIVRATIDLARNLGLVCTAEGVEDAATLARLVEFDCEQAQGFYFSRPLPESSVPAWIARNIPYLGLRPPRPAERPKPQRSLWLKSYDGSEEVRAQLDEALSAAVNPLWDLGRNSLIGWRARGAEIEVLMCPYGRIIDCFPQSRRLLRGRRQMGDGTFDEAQRLTGAEAQRIALPFAVGDGAGDAPADEVEQALRRCGITETLHRGVALFDIVGFSRRSPMLQVAQLNSLECSLNAAHKVMREMGLEIDLARTTTGDGFYVWNRRKGFEADVATYLLTLVALADNAVARLDDDGQRAPEVRVCFSVGPHYSYYQVEGLDPRGHDYIVGDVTISLARMSEKCLPGQILIGEFQRPGGGPAEVGALEFVALAAQELEKLRSVELRGRKVDDLRCYLTGRETGPGAFSLSRFLVRDKHGRTHPAFNQKFNLYVSPFEPAEGAAPVFLGLHREALGKFDAEQADLQWSPSRPAKP